MAFVIGSKCPKTRRGQRSRVFTLASRLGLDKEDVHQVAERVLGRRIESLGDDGDLTDQEMFLLWAAFHGHDEIKSAHIHSGNGVEEARIVVGMTDGTIAPDDVAYDERWL